MNVSDGLKKMWKKAFLKYFKETAPKSVWSDWGKLQHTSKRGRNPCSQTKIRSSEFSVLSLQFMLMGRRGTYSAPSLKRLSLTLFPCTAFAVSRFAEREAELPGARQRARRCEWKKTTLYFHSPAWLQLDFCLLVSVWYERMELRYSINWHSSCCVNEHLVSNTQAHPSHWVSIAEFIILNIK
jgi:hypothetical protein